MTSDQPHRYGLVMPFVTVRSVGGPHDDDAYAAGWEMATLNHELDGHTPLQRMLRTASLAQADLIAMRHGYVMRVVADEGAWSWVGFRREVTQAAQ